MNAVNRLKEHLSKSTNTRKMDVLLNNLNSLHQQSNKIAIPTLEGVYFFQISDIICLESDGSYTKMYFSNRAPLLVTRSLKDFEEMLDGYGFFRVHHSYMINLSHIKQYLKGDGGSVILNNDMQIDVSRRRKEEFLEVLHLK
jgi:two-component system LytT family response regulator